MNHQQLYNVDIHRGSAMPSMRKWNGHF